MPDKSTEWQSSALAYLQRLGNAEWEQQGRPIPKTKRSKRYVPSEYHQSLIHCLNHNDEESFKALKMLSGYASALGV